MRIKKKSDIGTVLDNFGSIASWDSGGGKHYLVFADRERGGQWTLMKYGDSDKFSVHGLGGDYSDDGETFFDERASVAEFLWRNRTTFNAAVKASG